ncbi:MAG: BrnT family toxin [Chloroflexi bacterium]|nr:BrnT family toxin [Chloroflexota bacterium]
MHFEWDERKRQSNIRKHGFDFADAPRVFDGVTLTMPDARKDYGELRFITFGMVNGIVIVVAHTEETEYIRIISMRKATRNEVKAFFKEIGH